MEKTRKIGTTILLAVMVLGMCVVLSLPIALRFKQKGCSNAVINFLTQNAEPNFDWVNYLPGHEIDYAVPVTNSQRILNIVTGVEDMIEDFCTSCWPGNEQVKKVADAYKEDLLAMNISQTDHGVTLEQKIQNEADRVQYFSDYCNGEDIDFIYVNLPSADRITGEVKTIGLLDASDNFVRKLEDAEVSVLNIAEDHNHKFATECCDHWMPADALYSAGVLASALNERCGSSFDIGIFDESSYTNYFSGTRPELSALIQDEFGYDFNLPVSISDFEYTVLADSLNAERVGTGGDFVSVFLTQPTEWKENSVYHATSGIRNGYYWRFRNTSGTNNDGKRILFLGDSFTWYMMDYLSQDVEEISWLNPIYFDGNVYVYIEDYQPDVVVWAYNERQLVYDAYEWTQETFW